MVSKKEIADKLKELGLANIKLEKGGFDNNVSYKDSNGKMVKGIRGGSIGPMTMTSAHAKRDRETELNVVRTLKELGYELFEETPGISFKIIFQISEKQNREIFFCWDYYPTNHHSMDLDSGYQTNYLILKIKDIKR